MPRPTTLVCGNVTLDRVGGALVPGGTAWYASRALAALGARPRVFTSAGPDYPPSALAGIEAEIVPAERTTLFVNVFAPDGGRTQRVEAAAPPLDPARLPAGWREADALLLAPILGETDPRRFGEAVRSRVAVLGVQGLVRTLSPEGIVEQPRWEFERADLAHLGAAVLGEDDVRGQGDLVSRLARAVPVVVFTHGVRGCEVIVRGRTRRVGVYRTEERDPVGAGDVFAAGLLVGLSMGEAPEEAARLGAAAASVVVEGIGGETLARTGEAWERREKVPLLG